MLRYLAYFLIIVNLCACDRDRQLLMLDSAREGDSATVEHLLENGLDPNFRYGESTKVLATSLIMLWFLFCAYLAFRLIKNRGFFRLTGDSALEYAAKLIQKIHNNRLLSIPLSFQVIKCSDEVWQKVVLFILNKADFIVIDLTDLRESVLWELSHALDVVEPERILLVYESSGQSNNNSNNNLPADVTQVLARANKQALIDRCPTYIYSKDSVLPLTGWRRKKSTEFKALSAIITPILEQRLGITQKAVRKRHIKAGLAFVFLMLVCFALMYPLALYLDQQNTESLVIAIIKLVFKNSFILIGILGILLMKNMLQSNGVVLWLRPFHRPLGKGIRFHKLLSEVASQFAIPITVQDSSYQRSVTSGFLRSAIYLPVIFILIDLGRIIINTSHYMYYYEPRNIFSQVMGRTPLMEAASEGRTNLVKILLKGGSDPNYPWREANGKLYSILNPVVYRRDYSMASLLIEANADPNQLYDEKYSTLIDTAYMSRDKPMLRLLIKSGAHPNANGIGSRALVNAIKDSNMPMVQQLLQAGANPDLKIYDNNTALIEAASKDKADESKLYTKLLLEIGANPDIVDRKSRSALYAATERDHIETISLLLNAGADPNIKTDNYLDTNGRAPLHLTNKLEVAKLLLTHGADPEIKDGGGMSALQSAVYSDRFDIARLLLQTGADPNSTSRQDNTALDWAYMGGEVEIFKLLLALGAKPVIQVTQYEPRENAEEIKRLLDEARNKN